MIRLKDMGYIPIRTEVNMKGSFIWINRKEKGLRYGQMERNTLENTKMEKRMEVGCSSGQMGALTMENFWRTILRAKVSIDGLMAVFIKGTGLIIRCMASGHSPGLTGEGTKVRTIMTKKRD